MSFTPLKHSICFNKPRRLTDVSSWHEHIPFAFTIVELSKPKVIIELGTHKGDSYCAFCQAVETLRLDTACYAVDTWEGDEHSGLYSTEVLEELHKYHDPLYGRFSGLIQSRFDHALNYFPDDSVDILHIDGLHSYEAVKHDFENWLPKLSRNGIVLIHDTNVREREFGVWRLWQEIKDKYPSFEFKHGHGLGVLAVGIDVSAEVLDFLEIANRNLVAISEFFSHLGNKISLQYKVQEQNAKIIDLTKQITELNDAHHVKDVQIAGLISTNQAKDQQIVELVSKHKADKDTLEEIIKEKNLQITNLTTNLNNIYNSYGWKAISKFCRLLDKLLPVGSKRRNFFKKCREYINKKMLFFLYLMQKFKEKLFLSNKTKAMKTPLIVPKISLLDQETEKIVPFKDEIVSIIIPTKNAGENFEYILTMIRNQKGFENIEIIVVDSGSTDETLELAKEYKVKIIEIPAEMFSHSYARNLGADQASGNYFLFTVQDALPPSNLWLYELMKVMRNNNVSAVSCAEYPRKDADLFYRIISWNHYRFLEVDKNDRIMSKPDVENHINLRKNGQLSDLACLISRDVFFKYRYRFNYAEDLDLGIRLIKDGYKIAFLSSTRIIHSHNRPAYYFLKRGYVDNIFLSDIFIDFHIPPIQLNNLIRDIFFTYDFLNTLIREDISNIKLPCTIPELTDLFTKKFESTITKTYQSINIDNNQYVDTEFMLFVNKIYDEYSISVDKVPYDGILMNAMRGFINITFDYMKNTYESIDELLIEDIKTCMYKEYALLCGAHLAYCYLKSPDNVKHELKKLDKDLRRGI